MFCSTCLDGSDKNETAVRGLNSWVLNFIYFNRVQFCEKKFVVTIREIELSRETLQNVQIFKVHKLDLFLMVGRSGKVGLI